MADDVHGLMEFMLYVFMRTLLTMLMTTTTKTWDAKGVFTIRSGKHNGR